jgi:pimeloyl-ACP methyl ester carboxylesterase
MATRDPRDEPTNESQRELSSESRRTLASESRYERVHGLRYHVRCWGPPEAPPVLLLHGWMDASASFQFLVDALATALPGDRRFLAPDWRGFGLSEWAPDGIYTYDDYLADLAALIEALGLKEPVPLIGHSLGGNIACLYAAARPERVRCIVNLEGFGLRARTAIELPEHLRHWLDELERPAPPRAYPGLDALAARVHELSERITPERARFVALHWSRRDEGGEHQLLADPRHRRMNPAFFRLDEARACWSAITAPVLWVEGEESQNGARHHITAAGLARRRASFRQLTLCRLPDCGHMMHWERPQQLARVIEPFLRMHLQDSSDF